MMMPSARPRLSMLATSGIVRKNASQLRRQAALSRSFSSPAVEASSGPAFKKWFWISTGVMFGIPGALGAAFVYNLKTDDDFYEHFNDKYPDLVAWINEYVPLNEEMAALAAREDVGDVSPLSELQQETMTVVAELASGKKVRFQAQGNASQQEIERQALSFAASPRDRVIAIAFDEEAEATEQTTVETLEGPSKTITTAAAWPPAPRTLWTGKPKPRADVVREAREELEALRLKQLELEQSKYAGRDIDEADEEIRVLEERKTELKKLLPRKRFLWIF
ncbi:hypothetical protein ATCC90586_002044 [Pythium insidiosum]|nr:hypothetical protein ATCC90586_002044 [Pythium insidiosum]